jgi:hypothetical protein
MAKSGLKIGTPANGRFNVTGNQLRKDMNRQASSQHRMAQASSLNLSTSGDRNLRPFKMVSIGGTTVKRYI